MKPDLVAPGGHLRRADDVLHGAAHRHPEFIDGGIYFTMSGTSQAAAVVSGVVALMLQTDPTLTPDEVKYRFMASAHRAENGSEDLGYTVFQQGAGLVSA